MSKIKLKCKQCGREFYTFQSCINKGGGKYCSINCVGKSRKKTIKIVCKHCNREFEVSRQRYKNGQKYCSFECHINDVKNKIKHICIKCGKEFEANNYRKNVKYCSRECRRSKIVLFCKKCGKQFEVFPSEKNRKYCSKKCYENKIKVNCITCGKEFEAHYSRKNVKYCSTDCHNKNQSYNQIIKKCIKCGKEFKISKAKENYKHCSNKCRKNHIEIKCLMCGKQFEILKSLFDKKNRKYCSKKCCNLMQVGENHPGWKGDNKNPKNTIKENTLLKRWEKAVKHRDNYRCKICNVKGNSKFPIAAHHLYGYHCKPKLRFIVKNGITMCEEHHREFHNIYGRKFNNPYQYYIFKNKERFKINNTIVFDLS